MPPANSPDIERPPSLISALRELESPINQDVLNLAATLGMQSDDARDDGEAPGDREAVDIDEALSQLRQLRRERDHDHQRRIDRTRERILLLESRREDPERLPDDQDQRDRLHRVMGRLSRLTNSNTTTSSNNTSSAYGDRVPSYNNLYDWSPANEADDEDELDQILAELRREQPNTHPDILRVLGQSQLDAERERSRNASFRLGQERSGGAGTGESPRSAAILQSVRRHPRFSARTRDYLQRYNVDNDAATTRPSRLGLNSESQARLMSNNARQIMRQGLADTRTSLDRERRDMLSRADSYRRSYLDHRASSSPPTVSPMLAHTVKYLSRIRQSCTIDDSLNYALDAGFLTKDYFCMQYADFITDANTIPPPAETSWLAPGAVLSGCQHATNATMSNTANQFRTMDGSDTAVDAALSGLAPPTRPWLANTYSTPRSRSSQLLPEVATPQPPQQDRWPVKVTIHAVDWEKMTLSATMEAYNVPSHPHLHQTLNSSQGDGSVSQQYTRTSSITTYLEGEILDFNQHTLLTESFKSNAGNDATYWRKLPPFHEMSDEDVIRALTSKKWFTEVFNTDWILMRWKERCFVKSLSRSGPDLAHPQSTSASFPQDADPVHSYHSHLQPPSSPPTPYRLVRDPSTNELQVEISHLDAEHATFDDSGCGLTISGFYYVCLRRSDGRLDGLYYDPQSSPYQCLKLESRRGGAVGAWGFR